MPAATLLPFLPPPGLFEVSVTAEGASTLVAIRGDADLDALGDLVWALAGVVADHQGDVVVDMAQSAFIDTAALRAVSRARAALERDGRQLTIRSPSQIAARMIAIFGLSHLVGPDGTRT